MLGITERRLCFYHVGCFVFGSLLGMVFFFYCLFFVHVGVFFLCNSFKIFVMLRLQQKLFIVYVLDVSCFAFNETNLPVCLGFSCWHICDFHANQHKEGTQNQRRWILRTRTHAQNKGKLHFYYIFCFIKVACNKYLFD